MIDLQRAANACYEDGSYGQLLDYGRALSDLRDEDAAFIAETRAAR